MGFIDQTKKGKYSGTPITDDVGLAYRAFADSFVINGVTYNYTSNREAHSNLMPFIGAYFWVRIPDPAEE